MQALDTVLQEEPMFPVRLKVRQPSLTALQQAERLRETRQMVSNFVKSAAATHPYGGLSANKRLTFTETTVDRVLHLAPARDDMNLGPVLEKHLRVIRDCAGQILGRKSTEFYRSIPSETTKITRPELDTKIPFTRDVSSQVVPLTDQNVRQELELHDPVQMPSEELNYIQQW